MKEYSNFQPEDFAQDDLFIHWVKSTDISAETFWRDWLETYPFKRNDIEIARQLVLLTQNFPDPDIPDSEMSLLKESVFEKIESIENDNGKIRSFVPWWAAAAVVAGILLFTGWYALRTNDDPVRYKQLVMQASESYDLLEVNNHTKSARLVNLPDGSSVILKKGSKLSYPNHFEIGKREIYLTGEAFFEIVKDPEKPFYVYANEVVTKVLGTSFNIKAYEADQAILVTVKTGKVAVYASTEVNRKAQSQNNRLDGTVLVSNQTAVFEKGTIKVVEERILNNVIAPEVQIDQMTFEYSEEPLGEIFDQLAKAYDLRIVYDKERLAKCPVTASLTGEPLNEKLKLICKAVRVDYETINGEIVVSGKGCE